MRSTAWPLAAAVAALVVYASLYPFTGWRWPPGLQGIEWLRLPWPPWRDRFDEAANFLGYVPLGALLYGAMVRDGARGGAAMLAALAGAAALSVAVELAQQFIPSRVPSLKDCAFNLGGAAAGGLLGLALQALGVVDRWQGLRQRWFRRDSATALVLLLLWPVALLFPAPVPLGLGHVWGSLRRGVEAAVEGTPWDAGVAAWLERGAWGSGTLSRLDEGLVIALGLLAPCLVAYVTTKPGWHRLLLIAGAAALAVGVTTLSAALNFGPEHALAWWTPATLPGLALGVLLALLLVRVTTRLAATLGVLTLALLLALVAQAPSDPYFAASLEAWERGRFIRFHGLARWIGYGWPFGVLAWLVVRLARRRGDWPASTIDR